MVGLAHRAVAEALHRHFYINPWIAIGWSWSLVFIYDQVLKSETLHLLWFSEALRVSKLSFPLIFYVLIIVCQGTHSCSSCRLFALLQWGYIRHFTQSMAEVNCWIPALSNWRNFSQFTSQCSCITSDVSISCHWFKYVSECQFILTGLTSIFATFLEEYF